MMMMMMMMWIVMVRRVVCSGIGIRLDLEASCLVSDRIKYEENKLKHSPTAC